MKLNNRAPAGCNVLISNIFRVQVIVSGNYDYSDPVIQHEVENLTQTFENTSYISNTLYTESWLRSFLLYADRNKDYLNITVDNKKEFIKNLKEVSSMFETYNSNKI